MKKILVIILALIMVVSLTSCATTGSLIEASVDNDLEFPVENEDYKDTISDGEWNAIKLILDIGATIGTFAIWSHIR